MKKIARYRLLRLIALILFTTLIGVHLTAEDIQNKFIMITAIALIACAWMIAFTKSGKID